MKPQLVEFDRYRVPSGTLDKRDLERETEWALLVIDLDQIERSAAVLRKAKVVDRKGLTTPALEEAYFNLRSRLGRSAPDIIRELQPGWLEWLSHRLRQDRELLGSRHDAPGLREKSTAKQEHLPRVLEHLEFDETDLAGRQFTDGERDDLARSESSPHAAFRQRIERILEDVLQSGWTLEKVHLSPVASGRRKTCISVLYPIAGGSELTRLLIIVHSGRLAASISLRPPVQQRMGGRCGQLQERMCTLFSGTGEASGNGSLGGLAGNLAAFVFHEAEWEERLLHDGRIGREAWVDASRLAALAPCLRQICRASPAARGRLTARLPRLIVDADWPDIRALTLAITAAIRWEGPGDDLYLAILYRCPPEPSRADLEFLVRAGDLLRLEAGPVLRSNKLARAILTYLESEPMSPQLAGTLRQWLSPSACDWAAADLMPLVEVCVIRNREGRLADAVERLGPIVELLVEHCAEMEPFLIPLADLLEVHWTQGVSSPLMSAQRLVALAAFSRLTRRAGADRWCQEPVEDLWAILPGDSAGLPLSTPPTFNAMVRDWLRGRPAGPVRRCFILDASALALERLSRRADPAALATLQIWLSRRGADPALYHELARRRVSRLVFEFTGDVPSLVDELHAIAAIGPAREVRLDLTRLADGVLLRPRAGPLDPGWDLAASYDEIVIAACTDPAAPWIRRLARWHMAGLLRDGVGATESWLGALNRCKLEDLPPVTWDEVLAGFEVRVAAGRLDEKDLRVLEGLAKWLEVRGQPIGAFEHARSVIDVDTGDRSARISWRLSLSAALRRGSPSPMTDSLPPPTSFGHLPAHRPRLGVMPRVMMNIAALIVCMTLTWLASRSWPDKVAPEPAEIETPAVPRPEPSPPPQRLETAIRGKLTVVRSDRLNRLDLSGKADTHLAMDFAVFHPPERGLPSRLYIASTETTLEQFEFVMGKKAVAVEGAEGPYFPVTNVSWKEAKEFCRRIQGALGREAGEVRLLREMEWHSLAGSPPGDQLEKYARFGEKRATKPFEVKQTNPSPIPDIYDLRGNVSEWLDVPYQNEGVGTQDVSNYQLRSARGGSRRDSPEDLEKEIFFEPSHPDAWVGFRIVVIPPVEE